MILTAASDNCKYCDKAHHNTYNYINHLTTMINSLNITNPNLKKKVLLINSQKEFQFENTIIEYLKVDGTPEHIRTVSCHIRTKLFMQEMDKEKELIWIDMDTIVRGSLDELISRVNKPDGMLAVQHRLNRRDDEKFNSGVVVFNTCDKSKETIKLWNEYAKGNKWLDEQGGLYRAAIRTNINRIDVELKYNDPFFSDDSIIWHCKGHYKNPKWIKECQKYR